MPNRILRDGILRSEKVANLSPQAEVFYRRLMSVADDFGRYYGNPTLLLSDCFPLRPLWATEEAMSLWIEECKAASLIITYEVSGTRFLEIQNFGQRLKPGQKSKFPDVPGIAGKIPENPASRARSSSPPTTHTPPKEESLRETNFETSDAFEKIWLRHPKKKNRALSEQAYASALDRGRFTVGSFELVHSAWCLTDAWTWKQGNSCPVLAEWIEDQGWKSMPPVEINGGRETAIERAIREA